MHIDASEAMRNMLAGMQAARDVVRKKRDATLDTLRDLRELINAKVSILLLYSRPTVGCI